MEWAWEFFSQAIFGQVCDGASGENARSRLIQKSITYFEKSSLERGLASAAIFSSVFSMWV